MLTSGWGLECVRTFMGVGWFLQMCAYVKTPEKLDVLGVSRDPESSLFQWVRGVCLVPPLPRSHQEVAILGSKPVGALKFCIPGHCFRRTPELLSTADPRLEIPAFQKSKVWQIESAGICGHLGQLKLVGGLSSSACFSVTLHGSAHSVYFLLPQCSPWSNARR